MPNYVTNVVYAKNIKKLLSKFTRVENGERVVDFNKLVPMPKDLDISCGSMSYVTNTFGLEKERYAKQSKYINPLLKKYYTSKITQSKFVSAVKKDWDKIKDKFTLVYGSNFEKFEDCMTVLKGFFNTKRYGYKDWYDWSIANWGTKWNASETRVFDKGIQFDTAWSCPVSLLKELSKHTPIVVSFADEDTGSNYGIYEFNNGKSKVWLDDSNNMAGEAIACRGCDEDAVSDFFSGDFYSDEDIKEYFNDTRENVVKRHTECFREAEYTLLNAIASLGGK